MEGLSERQAGVLQASVAKMVEVLDQPSVHGWSLTEKYGTTELFIKPSGNVRYTCFKDTLPCNSPISAAYEFLRDVRCIPIVSPVSESIEVVAKTGANTRFIHMILKAFFPYPRRKVCFLCRSFVQDGGVPFIGFSMISNGGCDADHGGEHLPSFTDDRETMNVGFFATVNGGRTHLVAILQKTVLMHGCGSSLAQILPRELADKLDFRFRLWLTANMVGRMKRGIELFQRGEIWWQKDDLLQPGLWELHALGQASSDIPLVAAGPVEQIEPARDEAMAKADEIEALARDLEDKLSMFALATTTLAGPQDELANQYSLLHERCLRVTSSTIGRLEEQLARIVILQQSPLDLVPDVAPPETLAQRQAAVAAAVNTSSPAGSSAPSPQLPDEERLVASLLSPPQPSPEADVGAGVHYRDSLAQETVRVQNEIEMLKRRHTLLQSMCLTNIDASVGEATTDDAFTKRPRWAARPVGDDLSQAWMQPPVASPQLGAGVPPWRAADAWPVQTVQQIAAASVAGASWQHQSLQPPPPQPPQPPQQVEPTFHPPVGRPLPPLGAPSRRGGPTPPPLAAAAPPPPGFPFVDPEPTLYPAPMIPEGTASHSFTCSSSCPTLSLPPCSPALPPVPIDPSGCPPLGSLDPYAVLAAICQPGDPANLYEALSPDISLADLLGPEAVQEEPPIPSSFPPPHPAPFPQHQHPSLPPHQAAPFASHQHQAVFAPHQPALALQPSGFGQPQPAFHPGHSSLADAIFGPPTPAPPPPVDRLSTLPPALLVRVLACLGLEDRAACGRTCRALRAAAASDALWLPTLELLYGVDAARRCGRKIAPGTPVISLLAARRRAEVNWRAGRVTLSSPCICTKSAGKPVRVVTMLDPAEFRESILLSGGGDGVVRVHVGPYLRPIQNFKARSGVGVGAMRVAHPDCDDAGVITIAYRDGTIAHWDMVGGTLKWRFTGGELARSGSLDGITLGSRLVATWGSTSVRPHAPMYAASTPSSAGNSPPLNGGGSPGAAVASPPQIPPVAQSLLCPALLASTPPISATPIEYVVRVHDLIDRGKSGPPPVVALLGGHARRVTCASLCEGRGGESPLAVSGSADGFVRVWDLGRAGSPGGNSTTAPNATLAGHTNSIIQAELSGGYMLVSASKDRSVRIWDLRQPPERAAVRRIPHAEKVTAVAARLDVPSCAAPLLVTSTEDAALRIFDLRAGTPLAHLPGAIQSAATAIAVAPFDAAVGCKDGSIRWLTFD